MSKKESYIKYKKLAEKLLNKYGTEKVKITLAMNIGDDDVPFQVNPQKVVEYNTVGVIMPPVRGLYFQGTRFGFHTEYDKGDYEDKMSCMVLPIYDDEGKVIDLSKATHITIKNVDGSADERYRVFFCDVMKPADVVILFSFGLGR